MSKFDSITEQEIENGVFPLQEILDNSFYYPSSGFDGGIIKDCNTKRRSLKIVSFIFCDYATGELAFNDAQNTFLGYKILGSRNVEKSELTPNGWQPQFPPNFNLQTYQKYKDDWKPFAKWIIYERDENHGEDHGPKRFSLLYIGGEGVATYQALYWSNNATAKALAIIQPGTGFGLNWTDFTDRNGSLAWVVNNNPNGKPKIIYYGGIGQGYDDFEWNDFEKVKNISPYYDRTGEVGIWKKKKPFHPARNPSHAFKIESFILDQKELENYALAFKEALPNWQNFLGEPIYMNQDRLEQDAEELIEAISNASLSKCIILLKEYEAIPERLFRVKEFSSGTSESLPIYTGIRQISLEGQGSILVEAFFGAELHLLDSAGRLLSIYNYEYPPELGLEQMYLIDCNSHYDSYIKGRNPDPTFVDIVGYAPENIIRNFSFPSKKGKIYEVKCSGMSEAENIIIGTGNTITVSNLKNIGAYQLLRKGDAEDDDLLGDFHSSWVCVDNFHNVGLEWKNIRDFTIQYNTFPFLNKRDHWVINADALSAEDRCRIFAEGCQENVFIEKYLKEDPFSFQFMPSEIRGNRFWVKAFCLKEPVNFLFVELPLCIDRELSIELIRSADAYTHTVYPYLSESMRKDVDILIVMKETGNLFHLPEAKDVGEEKFNDIREFVSNNRSRIYEILELFPNVLDYAPEDILSPDAK